MPKENKPNDGKVKQEIDAFVDQVARFFNEQIVEEKARITKFVQRKSKITGQLFLTVFTFGMSMYGTPTLAQLSGLLNTILPELDLSREAVQQRINEYAVDFFEEMLSLAIELEVPSDIELPVIESFERILIFDSTSFQLPDTLAPYFRGSGGDASKSAIKILFGYDFKSAKYFYVILNGTDPDHLINNGIIDEIGPKDLVLVDLGYFGGTAFAIIQSKGAFILSRLKSNVKIYQKNEETGDLEEFDLVEFVKNIDKSQTEVEVEVYLKAKDDEAIKLRLIIEQVPEKVKSQRLRKLNKKNNKKGRQTKKITKILQGFNLHITNAPSEAIPKRVVRQFYAIRWQIELIFKSWKSNFQLDKITGRRPERIKCMIYAKLLFIFITTKIIRLACIYTWNNSKREVSEFQAAKHFKIVGYDWMKSINNNPQEIKATLLNAFYFITKRCLKSKSNTRIYPIEALSTIEAQA
ncbi:MAG: IS4 family transposase [Chloroflexota bacterium]|nr:IS4 family transposase [Chloroflexota bacterium]